MGASTPRHHSSSLTLPRLVKKILTLSLYALVPLGLLHYLLRPTPVAVTSSISTSPLNGTSKLDRSGTRPLIHRPAYIVAGVGVAQRNDALFFVLDL
jgi:hypothetical protein